MDPWAFAESFALIPALGCALAFAALFLRLKSPQPALFLLLFSAFAIRWLFLIHFANPSGDLNYDAESYKIVGGLVRAGDDVYAATDRHPYLPFQMYFMGLASWLDAHTEPKFFTWVRWPNIIADLAITFIIYKSLQRLQRSESETFWLTMIWVLNPISIYTSTIHGQFDSTAVCFSLIAWYFLYFWQDWRGVLIGGIAMGFAILDKTWPLMWVAPLMVMAPAIRHRLAFLVLAGAVPLLGIAIYDVAIGTTLDLIEARVVDYDAVPNRYGFTYAFGHYLKDDVPAGWLPYFQENGRQIFLTAIIIVTALVVPRRDALTSCIALFATFLVFAHGWGSQYLVWVIPFAILARQRWMLLLYTAVATTSVWVYYFGACGYRCPGRFEAHWEYWEFAWVWPVAMLWLAREVLGALAAGRNNDSPLVLGLQSLWRRWSPAATPAPPPATPP